MKASIGALLSSVNNPAPPQDHGPGSVENFRLKTNYPPIFHGDNWREIADAHPPVKSSSKKKVRFVLQPAAG